MSGVTLSSTRSFTNSFNAVKETKSRIDEVKYGASILTAGKTDQSLRSYSKLYSALKQTRNLNYLAAGGQAYEALKDLKKGNYVDAAEHTANAAISTASARGVIDKFAGNTAQTLAKNGVGAGATTVVVGSALNVVTAAKDGIAEYARTGSIEKGLMKYADKAGGTDFNEGLNGIIEGQGSTSQNIQKMGEGAAKLIGADYLIDAGKWLGESAAKLSIAMGF